MIDPGDLIAFLNKIEGGTVPIDLLKIGQNNVNRYNYNNGIGMNKHKFNTKYRIALDIEDCLDRFYGGYYSDWACGGQWNRAYQFVQLLINTFNSAHIEIVAFFDGTLKENKKLAMERNDFRQRTISVLKHIRISGTPPPKIWWLPPSGLRTSLRNALRSINVQVVQTVNDHTMELIDYYYEHKLHAILGLHPDYVISNCSRFFSSHDLRLSYKGALETKEYLNSKLLSTLSLTPDHLPFIAVLLCGYTVINEIILKAIYQKLKMDYACDLENRIRKIAEIVRNSPTNDIDEFIKHLQLDEWKPLLRESIEYYQKRGKFENHRTSAYNLNRRKIMNSINNINNSSNNNNNNNSNTINILNKSDQGASAINATTTVVAAAVVVPLASETNENDEIGRKILNDVNNLVIDEDIESITMPTTVTIVDEVTATSTATVSPPAAVNVVGQTDVPTCTIKDKKPVKMVTFAYSLPGEVLKTALNRHQRGIMDPRVYQILSTKQILLPQLLEDEHYIDLPSIHQFYRPARQMIYAVLYNLYHQKYLYSKNVGSRDEMSGQSTTSSQQQPDKLKSDLPEVIISEWVWSPKNEYKTAELVTAQLLPWAVPTIQRLWFGMAFEDKQRRMKAFLTIMRSDSPLMLNRGYVPQHLLVLACVLRYIITNTERNILTRPELDAFLATAFSPYIHNVEYTQELVLPGVHLRGIYLASLFMQGVETASLANDASGVPLPWMMTNPWLFFDGKLFHLKLKMSTYVESFRELCDDNIELVLKIERFRKAIMEDVKHYLLPTQSPIESMYNRGMGQYGTGTIVQQHQQFQQHEYNKMNNMNHHNHHHNQHSHYNNPTHQNHYHNNNNNHNNNNVNNNFASALSLLPQSQHLTQQSQHNMAAQYQNEYYHQMMPQSQLPPTSSLSHHQSASQIGYYNDSNSNNNNNNNMRYSTSSSGYNRMKHYGNPLMNNSGGTNTAISNNGGNINGIGGLNHHNNNIYNGPINRQHNSMATNTTAVAVAAASAAAAAAAAATANNRHHHNGYQLKVGGVVVGSWAGGVPNRPLTGQQMRLNQQRLLRYPYASSMRTSMNSRFHRVQQQHQQQQLHNNHQHIGGGETGVMRQHRAIGRNLFTNNVNNINNSRLSKNRNRRNRIKVKKSSQTTTTATAATTATTDSSETITTGNIKNGIDDGDTSSANPELTSNMTLAVLVENENENQGDKGELEDVIDKLTDISLAEVESSPQKAVMIEMSSNIIINNNEFANCDTTTVNDDEIINSTSNNNNNNNININNNNNNLNGEMTSNGNLTMENDLVNTIIKDQQVSVIPDCSENVSDHHHHQQQPDGTEVIPAANGIRVFDTAPHSRPSMIVNQNEEILTINDTNLDLQKSINDETTKKITTTTTTTITNSIETENNLLNSIPSQSSSVLIKNSNNNNNDNNNNNVIQSPTITTTETIQIVTTSSSTIGDVVSTDDDDVQEDTNKIDVVVVVKDEKKTDEM